MAAKETSRLKSSTPIVVFAHIPLWTVYPQWGWGTDDSAQALSYLKRFGSVTVLKRTHSPNDAKGRRKHHVSHRDVRRRFRSLSQDKLLLRGR